MTNVKKHEKLKRATNVVCKQGMIPFPLSDTAMAIIDSVVGDHEEELDLIYAFREKASQTTEQLSASSGFSEEKVKSLALGLAKKGLVFNQANSSGLMVFRLLPFMVVGLMEYMFMGELKGTDKEKELARLFEKMTHDLRDQTWRNGTTALINSTFHLSVIDADACTGCGTCEERCPTDAIKINADGVARVDEGSCFGCGVCSRFCPENAISLKEGFRKVFIMPPKLRF